MKLNRVLPRIHISGLRGWFMRPALEAIYDSNEEILKYEARWRELRIGERILEMQQKLESFERYQKQRDAELVSILKQILELSKK